MRESLRKIAQIIFYSSDWLKSTLSNFSNTSLFRYWVWNFCYLRRTYNSSSKPMLFRINLQSPGRCNSLVSFGSNESGLHSFDHFFGPLEKICVPTYPRLLYSTDSHFHPLVFVFVSISWHISKLQIWKNTAGKSAIKYHNCCGQQVFCNLSPYCAWIVD